MALLVALAPIPGARSSVETHPAVRELWPAPDAVLRSGTLSFTGHATVGTFVGTTSAVTGRVVGSTDVAAAHGWVEAPVASLSTGNSLRDRDLRASMEVAKYPTMRFDLAGVTVESPGAPPDTVRAAVRGRLTIHGVTREVSIPATLVAVADTIDVAGGFPLDLADYRIGGLTKLFGTLRMQRNIEVRFRLRFQATPHREQHRVTHNEVDSAVGPRWSGGR